MGDVESFRIPIVEFSVGQVENGTELKFTMHKSEDFTGGRRKLVCNAPSLQYIGSNFAHDPSRDHMNQYLVLKNKKTGEQKVFLTDNYKLYPFVRKDDDIDSDEERRQAIEKVLNESRTFGERLDHLTEAFGSKIKKKEMAARQRNKVSDSTEVVKAAVLSMVEEEGTTSGSIAGEQNLSILPYDKEATTEKDIYVIDKFVPPHVRNSVSDASEVLLKPTAEKIKEWKENKNPLGSRYIAWRARHLHPSVSNDPETLQEYLNCLQILAYYMKVYAPTGSLQEKNEYLANMNPVVKNYILREFMPDTKMLTLKARLSAQVKDRILSYAVVLAWHIDSCQFDVQMLAEGFEISEKKLSMVVRALGGKLKVAIQEGMKRNIAILQLPLSFPTSGKRRASR